MIERWTMDDWSRLLVQGDQCEHCGQYPLRLCEECGLCFECCDCEARCESCEDGL